MGRHSRPRTNDIQGASQYCRKRYCQLNQIALTRILLWRSFGLEAAALQANFDSGLAVAPHFW